MKLKNKNSFGILVLRVFIGSRLFYGVIDNILSWEKMLEFSTFLMNFNFPFPLICATTSVVFQLLAAVAIFIGLRIHFFSILMIFNFVVALIFVHLPLEDNFEEMTPAMAILSACITFTFTGAGKFSLDYLFSKSEK